ncbi:MAG: right-handed parallel beta-helix repeat-containing protein [Bryobacteraceae bacterium]
MAGALVTVSGWMLLTPGVSANHPVFVEGEQDFDGDGRVGAAEDTDNDTDRIFGTLTAALGSANGGANQNGRIVIVTSGRFPEALSITGANGNVIIEAAPGIDVTIDAVLAGAMGNVQRQGQVGITIDAPANRFIILRNLTIRNWATGIALLGDSRVTLDRVRLDSNLNFGIRSRNNSMVSISDSQVLATGFRSAPGVNNVAAPGVGISLEDLSSASITSTTVSGSFSTGVANGTTNAEGVRLLGNNVFANTPNLVGVFR